MGVEGGGGDECVGGVRACVRARVCVKITIKQKTTSFSTDWGSFSSQRRLRYFGFVTETKGQTFSAIPGFYSTSGAMGYMEVIFLPILSP